MVGSGSDRVTGGCIEAVAWCLRAVAILPGRICSTSPRYRNFIRLSYGFPWSERLEKGLQTLGRIIAGRSD
jgi:DNA-binding transcriptional MocR family regulator